MAFVLVILSDFLKIDCFATSRNSYHSRRQDVTDDLFANANANANQDINEEDLPLLSSSDVGAAGSPADDQDSLFQDDGSSGEDPSDLGLGPIIAEDPGEEIALGGGGSTCEVEGVSNQKRDDLISST